MGRADAFVHCFADDRVHVTFVQQITGVSVIGTEHCSVTVRRLTKGEKRVEVFCRRALADHDPLTARELLDRFLRVGALVIGADACRDIGVKVFTAEEGCVTVDDGIVRFCVAELLQQSGVCFGDADGVHDLGESEDVVFSVIWQEIFRFQRFAAFFQRCGGHAGGEVKVDMHIQIFAQAHHIIDAVGTGDVGDLVRIRHDSRRTVRQ